MVSEGICSSCPSRRGDLDEDLSEEIAAHVDCAAAAIERGMSPADVRAAVFCRPPAETVATGSTPSPINQRRRQGDVPVLLLNMAAPDYFRSMAVPVIEGREFTDEDRPKPPPVAVIQLDLRAQVVGLASQPGAPEQAGGPYREGPTLEIVGVVGDVRQVVVTPTPGMKSFAGSRR